MSTTYNATFTSGPGAPGSPDATYAWAAELLSNNSVQVACNFGGGTNTNNTVVTNEIPWPSGGGTSTASILQTGTNPNITVSGTVTVVFDSTPGGQFAVTFDGTMSLQKGQYNNNCAAETISGSSVLVAAQLSA